MTEDASHIIVHGIDHRLAPDGQPRDDLELRHDDDYETYARRHAAAGERPEPEPGPSWEEQRLAENEAAKAAYEKLAREGGLTAEKYLEELGGQS